jgi:hypothetical protein
MRESVPRFGMGGAGDHWASGLPPRRRHPPARPEDRRGKGARSSDVARPTTISPGPTKAGAQSVDGRHKAGHDDGGCDDPRQPTKLDAIGPLRQLNCPLPLNVMAGLVPAIHNFLTCCRSAKASGKDGLRPPGAPPLRHRRARPGDPCHDDPARTGWRPHPSPAPTTPGSSEPSWHGFRISAAPRLVRDDSVALAPHGPLQRCQPWLGRGTRWERPPPFSGGATSRALPLLRLSKKAKKATLAQPH